MPRLDRLHRLWRFGGTAAVNTGFGYGAYALLIWAGLPLFAAQACAQILGMAFNFLTYRRAVFADRHASVAGYLLSYALHYAVGVALLALVHRFVPSPYLAGALALLAASLVNLLLLDRVAFRRLRQGSA